jgi:hypothetical protein
MGPRFRSQAFMNEISATASPRLNGLRRLVLRDVFHPLRSALQDRHLPAFQRGARFG